MALALLPPFPDPALNPVSLEVDEPSRGEWFEFGSTSTPPLATTEIVDIIGTGIEGDLTVGPVEEFIILGCSTSRMDTSLKARIDGELATEEIENSIVCGLTENDSAMLNALNTIELDLSLPVSHLLPWLFRTDCLADYFVWQS